MSRDLRAVDLGLAGYGETLELQRRLREARLEGQASDVLLLVEHAPTVTLGRRAEPGELLISPEELANRGFQVHRIERGGKATYHGPGQLVGYPIVSLRDLKLSVPAFVRGLEGALIAYLGELCLDAERRDDYPGVWVRGRKIAAVGVHLKRWVSIHGFALNLDPDLGHFETIIPCGIDGAEVTSVARELGWAPEMGTAKAAVVRCLTIALGFDGWEWTTRQSLAVDLAA